MPDWEIVGKKKKEIKLTRKEKKKEEQEFINTAPKLEELRKYLFWLYSRPVPLFDYFV